jgi:hypothetical protein
MIFLMPNKIQSRLIIAIGLFVLAVALIILKTFDLQFYLSAFVYTFLYATADVIIVAFILYMLNELQQKTVLLIGKWYALQKIFVVALIGYTTATLDYTFLINNTEIYYFIAVVWRIWLYLMLWQNFRTLKKSFTKRIQVSEGIES